MRIRLCTFLVAVALGLSLAPGAGAIARPAAGPTETVTGTGAFQPVRVAGTIYSQLDNDNGTGVVSQHFETRFLLFDSQGADDFRITTKSVVKQVIVDGGYFEGKGPANSIHVTFYKDAGGAPGTVVQDIPHAPYTDIAGGTGSFLIQIPKTTLKSGRYWLSVFVNMPFHSRGQWGWNTNTDVRHAHSLWRNPGNGFGLGCTTWERTIDCILSGEGGDFAFALLGNRH